MNNILGVFSLAHSGSDQALIMPLTMLRRNTLTNTRVNSMTAMIDTIGKRVLSKTIGSSEIISVAATVSEKALILSA